MADWFTGLLKTIKDQSPYYNMVFALICLFIIFLPAVISSETLSQIPELITFRKNFLPYISILFVILFVFSGGQFIKRIVDSFKMKRELALLKERETDEKLRVLQEKQLLLSKLEKLNQQGLKFDSRESCIAWANKVAPLLKFNHQYYNNFMSNFEIIPLNLSSYTLGPALDKMRSQVRMAIEELKNELETHNPCLDQKG